MTPPLNPLLEWLRIPSVSTQPESAPACRSARDYIAGFLASAGLETRILPSVVHSAVFAQTPAVSGKPTVLIYGHYDVQPPGPPSQWTTPAFEPAIRKNRLYARGASDNKGQLMIHVAAVRQLLDSFGPDRLPVNFKFIIEGEEEIGSPGVGQLLSRHPGLLSADYAVLSDTEMAAPGQPSIDTSLRGVMDVEIDIQTGTHDLHSGQFGGLAPNPALILADLLCCLKNGRGRITLPGFYRDVIPLSAGELSDFRRLEPDPADILKDGKFYYLSRSAPGLSLNRRRWSEPTLDVTGIQSGYTGQGTKSIIPDTASAKLSFRLVPDQRPELIYAGLHQYLHRHLPPKAVWRLFMHPPALPYKAPIRHPVYSLARHTLRTVFGRPAVFVGQGGSIGFIPILARSQNIPCILIGFGLPDDNTHAPNEFLSLENYSLGISAMTMFYSRLS